MRCGCRGEARRVRPFPRCGFAATTAVAPEQESSTDDQPDVELKILDERLRAWGLPQYQSEMAARSTCTPASTPRWSWLRAPRPCWCRRVSPCIWPIPGWRRWCCAVGAGASQGTGAWQSVGLIDADYTGGAGQRLEPASAGSAAVVLTPGERFAQMVFVPILRPRFQLVEAFTLLSERGAGGFGSTGSARVPGLAQAGRGSRVHNPGGRSY